MADNAALPTLQQYSLETCRAETRPTTADHHWAETSISLSEMRETYDSLYFEECRRQFFFTNQKNSQTYEMPGVRPERSPVA